MKITQEVKEKIWYLFFEKIKSIKLIEEYFNHELTRKEIRDVVWEKLK